MNYKFIRLTAYNEKPDEDMSYHVDVLVSEEHTFDQFMERLVKPAANCLFGVMIPEMPRFDPKNPAEFCDFQTKYYDAPEFK